MFKKSSQARDKLLAVTFLRSKVLFIHQLALKNQELEELNNTQIVNTVYTVTLGMTRIIT